MTMPRKPSRTLSKDWDKQGLRVPIVGDFHYNGHLLLTKYPGCAEGLAKYRINPGNASIGRKNDDNFPHHDRSRCQAPENRCVSA